MAGIFERSDTMNILLLILTIALFVMQTLSMKLQHAKYLPQKLLVNGGFSLLAAASMTIARFVFPATFTIGKETLWHGISFGILFALTILFYNLAIANGPLSFTAFYFSASMLIPAITGIAFFAEPLRPPLVVAIVLLLAAFWCLNAPNGQQKKPEKFWLCYCGLSFLCNGLCAVVQKSQQNATGGQEAAGLMLVGFCTAAVCYFFGYLLLRNRLPADAPKGTALLRQNKAAMLLLALGSVGGNLLLTYLAGQTNASYLFPQVQGSILLGVTICSVLFFKEKLSLQGKFGIALGLAAIIIINL